MKVNCFTHITQNFITMKKVKALLGILLLMFFVASCSSDDSTSNNGNNQLRIKASAVYSPTANRSANGAAMNEDVVLTSFKINIREIEFEFAEDYYDDNDNDGYDDGVYEDDLARRRAAERLAPGTPGAIRDSEAEMPREVGDSEAQMPHEVGDLPDATGAHRR